MIECRAAGCSAGSRSTFEIKRKKCQLITKIEIEIMMIASATMTATTTETGAAARDVADVVCTGVVFAVSVLRKWTLSTLRT
jgi:hypothetical protein